ncbi:MAG: hypothetical protein H0X45_12115 [Planctomycetes bacterium]|nr:hypothetical protein [Planctomycetota bacterium]
MPDQTATTAALIEVRGVGKTYGGVRARRDVLHASRFTLHASRFTQRAARYERRRD